MDCTGALLHNEITERCTLRAWKNNREYIICTLRTQNCSLQNIKQLNYGLLGI